MQRRAVLQAGALGLITAAWPSSDALAALATTQRDKLEEAAFKAIGEKACAGVQIAVAQDGAMQFSRGFGFANLEEKTPVTRRSVFRVGSLTKQFTAAATIKLARLGRLDLRAPMSSRLPFFAAHPVFTALELMTQTAGLHSDDGEPAPGAPTQTDLARAIAQQDTVFDFPPGTAWLYSNANYIVLAALIEAVTGAPFARAIEQLITRPLNLRATAIDKMHAPSPRAAAGYSLTDAGALEAAQPMQVEQAGGAGALRSTAEELCRWHDALLKGRLLTPPDLALMLAPGRLRDGRLSGANRFSADDAHYGDVQYACGLLVSPPGEKRPSIVHYGYIGGFAAVLQTWLNERLTFAAACNGRPGPVLPFRDIRRALAPV